MNPIRLADVLRPDTVFLDLDAPDRFVLIREVSARLGRESTVTDTDQLARDAILREEELSTGIDHGIAMPHARSDAVTRLTCAFVRPARPVDFGSADGRPCDLIFFSAVPRACVDQYLHFTAAVVRRLQGDGVVNQLRDAESAEQIISALGI